METEFPTVQESRSKNENNTTTITRKNIRNERKESDEDEVGIMNATFPLNNKNALVNVAMNQNVDWSTSEDGFGLST